MSTYIIGNTCSMGKQWTKSPVHVKKQIWKSVFYPWQFKQYSGVRCELKFPSVDAMYTVCTTSVPLKVFHYEIYFRNILRIKRSQCFCTFQFINFKNYSISKSDSENTISVYCNMNISSHTIHWHKKFQPFWFTIWFPFFQNNSWTCTVHIKFISWWEVICAGSYGNRT